MKKLVLIGISIIGLSAMGYANCGNGGDNGNGCSGGGVGPAGPQGPIGPQGPTGSQGSSGTNGSNGSSGQNGVDGKTGATGLQGPAHVDPRMTEARLGLDTAIRLYDGKRVQIQAYNIYSPSLHPSEDTIGDGRNLQFGVRLVFKLGSSFEERLLVTQNKEIEALRAIVAKLAH